MPANTSPIFALTPLIGIAQVTTANANRDGSGAIVDILTGTANGTRVDKVYIKAVGTTTAGMIRFFLYDGTNTRLWKEVIVSAITPSATVESFSSSFQTDLILPSTYKLRASTEKTETFNIEAVGADF